MKKHATKQTTERSVNEIGESDRKKPRGDDGGGDARKARKAKRTQTNEDNVPDVLVDQVERIRDIANKPQSAIAEDLRPSPQGHGEQCADDDNRDHQSTVAQSAP